MSIPDKINAITIHKPVHDGSNHIILDKTPLRPICNSLKPLLLPLYQSSVSAGFPSPADDYIERYLDLNELLIHHPSSTFLARAKGDSMIEIGIHCGDILIVDRAVTPQHLDVVVAALDGELVCKLLDTHHQCLLPANHDYHPINIGEMSDFMIEGVVVASIRCHRLVHEFEQQRR